MNIHIKYIKHRIKLLKETAKELKNYYIKTKIVLIDELSLEVSCYVREIENRLKLLEKNIKWK